MGVVSTLNDCFIKLFSYTNKNNEVTDVKTFYGQKWSDVKTDNKTLNSIFQAVDDGDGIVQAKELNILNRIALYIDSLISKTAGNEILEEEELNKFAEQLEAGEVDINRFSQPDTDNDNGNWSESLSRNITTISISKFLSDQKDPEYNELIQSGEEQSVYEELLQIGEEQGFNVNTITSGDDVWVEDSSIRRSDGKIYVPYHSDPTYETDQYRAAFTSQRGNRSARAGTRVSLRGNSFDLEIANKDKIYGTSYLEGGNVLNTLSKDGVPSAIIGEGSIATTLEAMGLKETPENIQLAKEQIANDLNIKVENITFIPQYDFHIDMLYRPLNNGEIAVPDFDEAINILQNNRITSMSEEEQNDYIARLERMKDKTKAIREEAEDNLLASGYKIVKIPCFTYSKKTNFMNGVGGTSKKTGQTFYITNKSKYPELQAFIEPYFLNAGIDKVYFVSTTYYLRLQGGIDCLTQEQ